MLKTNFEMKHAPLRIPVLLLGFLLALTVAISGNASAAMTSVGVQSQETSLGNLVTDAVRSAAKTPVAFIAAGSFKELNLPTGATQPGDISRCLQYPDDRIAVIELTGAELTSALERSLEIYPQKNLGFLQVSGMTVKFQGDKPKGSRVESITIGGDKLVQAAKYRVATTLPLAEGAYGYFTVWGRDRAKEVNLSTLSQALTTYLPISDLSATTHADRIIASK